MESNLLVSVIIPVFNVRPFLREALDSVIYQTYKNLEILIIDDGSTDGSGEICDKYADTDRRIRVIHQENRGLSAARNIGLDNMTGDIVAFIDPDDKYMSNYISLMVSTMGQYMVDIVVCKSTNHYSHNKMVQKAGDLASPYLSQGLYDMVGSLMHLADGDLNPNVWNKLYVSYLWDNIRFPEGHVFEDIATTYKVLFQSKCIYVIDNPLYLRRIRNGSITGTCTRDNIMDYIAACEQFEAFIEDNIPSIFSDTQLQHARQLKLQRLVNYYMRLSFEDKKGLTDFRESVRQLIASTGKDNGIGKSGIRMKMCYFMICYCPGFVKIPAQVYYRVKNGKNNCY